MAKIVSCFECGYDYKVKEHSGCPRCGENKIFEPSIHDPNYDMMVDPVVLAKYRIRYSFILLGLFVLTFTVILR
jgi:predicted nucleic-acid-binding Zn-ribbon protein